MNCTGPRLFRHRTTLQFWIAGCMRWSCQSCIRKVARRWRAILKWASSHGPAPEYFLMLTIRDPLPLWRHAPAEQQEEQHAQAVALIAVITRALSHPVETALKVDLGRIIEEAPDGTRGKKGSGPIPVNTAREGI